MKTNVLKKAAKELKQYIPHEANIVELDYSVPADKKAAEELYKTWQGAEFIPIITSSSSSPTRHIYAITTQNSGYENIDASKIMGIADFDLKGTHSHTRFLQAKPEIINQPDRDIKGVGRALMQGVISHFKGLGVEDMKVFVRHTEKPFYRNIFPNIEDKLSTAEDSSNMILRF
ncbi:MAG: hypothetical protein K6E29_00030 [Cyanobacteria bacterium RUI128]|nr:hypothetical protein [Cyanobacteria bacterium RUI128]